jgi:hypothetical protein
MTRPLLFVISPYIFTPEHVADGFVPALDLKLGIDIIDMVLHRLFFDIKRTSYLPVSFADSDKATEG